MTDLRRRHLDPVWLRQQYIEEGRILNVRTGKALRCPHESLFFRYARLPWIPPELREPDADAVRIAFSREWEPGEELRGVRA